MSLPASWILRAGAISTGFLSIGGFNCAFFEARSCSSGGVCFTGGIVLVEV